MPFSIAMDHDTFEAGSALSGALFISNERHISAKELRITFKGEERTRVVDKASKRASDESFLFHTYSQEVKDVIKGGKIKSGKYIVPFQMQLPDGLPQTVTIPWTHLSYVVGCEREDRKGKVVEHATAPVNILAMPCLHMPSPHCREPFMECVKKNRFKRGHFVIVVAIKDTVVEPGEHVGVSVAIRNRSPVNILKVKAMLKEEVFARADQQERKSEKMLTFHEFKEYRKTRRKLSKWLRGADPQEDLEEIQEDLESEEHEGMLRVPKNATLTYTGKLFDVKQHLYLHIQTDQKEPIEINIVPMTLERKVPVPVQQAMSDTSSEYEYPAQEPDVEHIK